MLKTLRPLYHRFKSWTYRYPLLFALLANIRHLFKSPYPQSPLAHRYLDGLQGIEIGASAFNPFGLHTLNINYTVDEAATSRRLDTALSGHSVNVDVVALGDRLPFADNSLDFVLTSHVIEHFFDPVAALREWYRVVKPGGYVFTIAPHKERGTFDKPRARTTLAELIERHASGTPNTPSGFHHSVWITEDFLELCQYLAMPVVEYQEVDDKVGNGFTVVIRKPEDVL